MTNYEKIKVMSMDEMVEAMKAHCIDSVCDIVCGGGCNAFHTLDRTAAQICGDIIRAWLEKESGE